MDTNMKAEKLVQKALKTGEEICWRGEGVPFKLLEKDSRKSLVTRFLVSGIGIIVMVGSCLLNNDGKWGFPMLIAALLLLLMIAPYFEAKSLQRCSYYLTNRRAFIVADDRTVHSMDLRYVDQVFVLDGAPIGDSLVLGSAMYRDLKKQIRWLAVHPRPTPGEQGTGMVFYSVRNAKEAKAYLDTLLTTK